MEQLPQEERREEPLDDNPGLRELVKRYPGLQAQIDFIVEERLKRERGAFDKRMQDEVESRTGDLQRQLRELAARPPVALDEAARQASGELARERDAWAEKAKSWEDRFKRGQAERMLLEAAVQRGAYKPRQVVDLLIGRVEWQDGEEGSTPMLKLHDDDGREIGAFAGAEIGKGVAAFLAGNPNLVAASNAPGAGGRPGVPGLPVTAEALRGLGVEDLRKLRPELERLAAGFQK